MLVTRKRKPNQPPLFQLCGMLHEPVQTFQYLGVILSSDLSWSSHVDTICSKAGKLTWLWKTAWTVVRPQLEYAAPVWDPHLSKDTANIERGKHEMSCTNNWDSGYQDLLDLTQMPILENRRLSMYSPYNYSRSFQPFLGPIHVDILYTLPLLYQLFAHTNAYINRRLYT